MPPTLFTGNTEIQTPKPMTTSASTGAPAPKTAVHPITSATIVTEPAKNMKNPNKFEEFFQKIGHGIEDVAKWAPIVGADATKVIVEAETLTPQFAASLQTLLASGASVAALASGAVAQKGLNPMTDINTIQAVEQLIGNFTAFYPLINQGIKALTGVVSAATVPPIATTTIPTSTLVAHPAPASTVFTVKSTQEKTVVQVPIPIGDHVNPKQPGILQTNKPVFTVKPVHTPTPSVPSKPPITMTPTPEKK